MATKSDGRSLTLRVISVNEDHETNPGPTCKLSIPVTLVEVSPLDQMVGVTVPGGKIWVRASHLSEVDGGAFMGAYRTTK